MNYKKVILYFTFSCKHLYQSSISLFSKVGSSSFQNFFIKMVILICILKEVGKYKIDSGLSTPDYLFSWKKISIIFLYQLFLSINHVSDSIHMSVDAPKVTKKTQITIGSKFICYKLMTTQFPPNYMCGLRTQTVCFYKYFETATRS